MMLMDLLEKDEYLIKESMKKHTSFKVGGLVDYYIVPKSAATLKNVLKLLKERRMEYYILGKGSNVVFGDRGYKGVVIEVGAGMQNVEFISDTVVKAEAGITLSKLAVLLSQKSLTGFEFASGIPGTLGGAVTMNAGAYEKEIKDCFVEATVMDGQGNIKVMSKEDMIFDYRYSIIQESDLIVIDVTLSFEKGNEADIVQKMKELNLKRKEKQPLEHPSAGSTFKRPEGHFAGKLIEEAGLAGYRVGGAQVSPKHCGFIVNTGGATAADIIKLMEEVRRIVRMKHGVMLEPEVRLVGDF